MLSKVVRRLWNHPFAQVWFPDEHKMREYADMVQQREPKVDDIIGFMDCVSFLSECTDKRIEQNPFYCGYYCDTMVNSVFAFSPDGKVIFAAINFPGSWATCLNQSRCPLIPHSHQVRGQEYPNGSYPELISWWQCTCESSHLSPQFLRCLRDVKRRLCA